jgi:exodeoxyribonuclease X
MKLARRLWPGIKYSNMALYKSRKLSVRTPEGFTITAPCMTAISPPRC